MIRRRHNRRQYQHRIPHPQPQEKAFPKQVLADFVAFEAGAEEGGVVDESAAYAESVAEMHRRHGGEGVYVFSRLPDGLGVVVADGVEEAVLAGEESGWHARVEYEGEEGEEVG